MRNKLKTIMITGLLAAVMVLAAGCGKKFDASGYVKSFMDMLTKGEVEEYMKYTGQSEEEAKKDYNAMTDAMMESAGGVGVSEDVQERFKDVYVKILAKSKYTVKDAVETDEGGYTVDVEIEPITGLYDGLSEEIQKEAAEYAQELISKGEEVDQTALTDWVFNLMLDKMEERMDSLSYGDPTTVTVEIEKDGNSYKIKDEEQVGEQIGMALIDTSSLE